MAYHVAPESIMEGAAYDVLFDELAALEAEHPELVRPSRRPSASARRRAGSDAVGCPHCGRREEKARRPSLSVGEVRYDGASAAHARARE